MRAHGLVGLLTLLSAAQPCLTYTLITFDVDGTLVKGSGQSADASAHMRSFAHGVGTVFGDGSPTPLPAEILPGAGYHGSTDGLISLRLARAALGVEPSDAAPKLPDVFRAMYEYCANLSDEVMTVGIEPLPGVIATLNVLADREDVVCGLVTGNVEGIARKKMRAVGILATGALAPPAADQSWPTEKEAAFLGGFGSDYCSGDVDDAKHNYLDRGEQIAIAARRARTLIGEGTLTRVVHVGDAPADVLAAKHCADARRLGEGVVVGCVGVATGSYSAELLREKAGDARPGEWEPIILERGIADEKFLEACGVE